MRIVRQKTGFYKVDSAAKICPVGEYLYQDHQSLNTVTITAGQLWITPIAIVDQLINVDAMTWEVTTLATGSTIKGVIYDAILQADGSVKPNQKLGETDAISAASTGAKIGTFTTPLQLPASNCYFAGVLAAGGNPILRGCTDSAVEYVSSATPRAGSGGYASYYQSPAGGNAPASWGAGRVPSLFSPTVGVRRSA